MQSKKKPKRKTESAKLILPSELVTFVHELESLLVEAPNNYRGMSSMETHALFKEVETRMSRLRFARRRGIPTSIIREAAEVGLFLAFFLHRMKETNGH